MDKKLKTAIAKNLLEDKTCENCSNQHTCNIKLGKQFNTCRKWKEYGQFKIKSYKFKAKPQRLKIVRSKTIKPVLDIDDDNYFIYKKKYNWGVDKDAIRELNNGKSCGNCLYRENCLNIEQGICNKHETVKSESLLIKQAGIELQKEINRIVKNRLIKDE